MKYEELLILLPCHSLEDFPLYHDGDDAHGLLAAWTALWRPELIAAAGKIPHWARVDSPPETIANRLLVVPTVAHSQLPTGFAQRAKDEGACLVRKSLDRKEIIAQALESLDGGASVNEELAADFLALGYCYLQVELLTRQMRYSSNLDQVHFGNQTVAAAQAAVIGDEITAREKLAACFDVLAEERDHYYPVDAYLLDLTMAAPTTLGAALQTQLSAAPANVLLSAELLETMPEEEPQSLAALREAVAAGRCSIVGGELRELRLPLLSCETILTQLRLGLRRYEELSGKRPEVFGRRRFGLVPLLPQALHKLGFTGAVHATFEEGRFPEGGQAKTRWESAAGIAIDALARAPLNAAQPGTYLRLATKMGESMDRDHVATLCLAHWPGAVSPWYDDLRRIARYVNALGKLVTLDEYFRITDAGGQLDRFEADQYRSPYLKEAIVKRRPDPISSVVRWWRRRIAAEAIQTIDALTQLVAGTPHAELDFQPLGESLLEELDKCGEEEAEERVGETATSDAACRYGEEQLADELNKAITRFAKRLPRKQGKSEPGYLVVNPFSFVRRATIDASELPNLPAEGRPIYAVGRAGERKHVTVDTPPMGFAWIPSGAGSRDPKPLPLPLADDGVLRNEFFEAIVSKETGGLAAVKEYEKRTNRLSQQLAFRLPGRHPQPGGEYRGEDKAAAYSLMAADSVETTISNSVMGEIVSRGRLTTRKRDTLASFTQRYRVYRGSRVIHVEVELDPKEECRPDPWSSYYCARFAWANEGASLWRGVNLARQAASAKRLEAPLYVEIEDGDLRTTVLTGGLPFHRRTDYRMLDSLLVVRGETGRTFRFGVGVELKNPLQEALAFLAPAIDIFEQAPAPANLSSWLFHVDARNVAATWWAPLVDDGRIAGVRVRLLENAGRPARMKLQGFRPFAAARQVDFLGRTMNECPIEDGAARVELAAGEWMEVEARFVT